MAVFNQPEASVGFDMTDAYRRASGNKPVRAKDLKTAYRPYGVKLGGKRKSDAKLYKMATAEVMQWYRQHHGKTKKASQRRRAAGRAAGAAQTGTRVQAAPAPTPTRATTTSSTRTSRTSSRSTTTSGVRIQRPAGTGFTPYGI